MKVKKDKKFQMVGFIEDADTERVSIVEHGANQIPFAVLKAEGEVELNESTVSTEFKTLQGIVDSEIHPTRIKFPFGTNMQSAENFMEDIFEKGTYTIEKTQDNVIMAFSNAPNSDKMETRDVLMPSGIIYTLSKFNIPDTMKTDKKENGNMSKQSKSKEKETQSKEAPVVSVETEIENNVEAEQVTEEVKKAETEEVETETETKETIENLKSDLVAALKALSNDDVAAIIKEVSTNEEAASAGNIEVEAEADPTEKVVEAKELTESTEDAENSNEETAPQSEIHEELNNLHKALETQNEKNEELSQSVAELAGIVQSLVATNEELSSKLEKSLSEEDALEVISELTKLVKDLDSRVDSLEYAPASSESSSVEKSVEVKKDKRAGFLSKHL